MKFLARWKCEAKKKNKAISPFEFLTMRKGSRSSWLPMKGIDCDVISANSKAAVEPKDNASARETLHRRWIIALAEISLSLSPPSSLSLSLSMNKYWIFVNTQKLCWWNKWWENWKSFAAAMMWIYDGTQSNSLNHKMYILKCFSLFV